VRQRAEKRGREGVEIGFGFADDVARHELRGVFVHVDETMQLAQHIVGNVAGGARFTVEIDRNVRIAATDFCDEIAQIGERSLGFFGAAATEFFIIDRHDETGRAALLLRK